MRNTVTIHDRLLVSSPNGGGLALLEKELCLPLMNADITGLAIGANRAVWCLQADGGRALRELRDGQSRTEWLSEGPLDLHDVLIDGDDLYVACTETNEVVRYDRRYRVQERWTLPGEADAMHINSLALYQGRLIASIFGRFSEHRGYKGRSRGAGELIDVHSSETLLGGLSQPHSLVPMGNRLFLCSSEDKELVVCEGFTELRRVPLPGYARGLALGAKHVYVGLSRSRNLEIESDTGSFESATVAVLDRKSLRMLAAVPVPWAEIYDIRILKDAHLATELVALGWTDERTQAEEVGKALQLARREGDAASRTLAQRETAMARLREQIDNQAEQLKVSNQAQAAAAGRASEQAQKMELEKAKVQGMQEQLAILIELHQSRDKELEMLRQTWLEAQKEMSQAVAEREALRTAVADAEAAIEAQEVAARHALAKASEELESLKARIERRDAQVVRLRSSHGELAALAIARQRELEQAGSELEAARAALTEQQAAAGQLAKEQERLLAKRHSQIGALEADLRAVRAEADASARVRTQQDDRIAEMTELVAQRDVRVAELTELVTQRDGRVAELMSLLEARQRDLAQAQARARDLGIRVGVLEPKLDELELIKGSRSWRLTRPLRFLMRLLRHRGLVDSDRERLATIWPHGHARLPQPALTEPMAPEPCAPPSLPIKGGQGVVHGQSKQANARHHGAMRPPRPKSRLPTQVLLAPQGEGMDDIYVWSVIDWHFRTQRPQHLARELAATGRRVFYVSNNLVDAPEPGFRVEPLDDSGRLFQVFLHVRGKPVIYFDPPEDEAGRQLHASLAALLDWTRSRRSLSLAQHPFWADVARSLPNHRLVYDCMDHHGGFDNNGSRILQQEEALMRAADLLVVSSGWLDEEGAKFNSSRALVRNAGEYAHFSVRPAEVFQDARGRRVIGYYGAIAQWFDVELVERVAGSYPDCLVLLVGGDTAQARARLAHCPNVEFTGEVTYASLPYYLYGFDVCMLPFQVLPLTLATNPVKAYEYLSAGKPLVAVDLPEMRQFGDLVRISGDQEGFVRLVGEALQEPDNAPVRARRRAFAADQTWSHRALEFLQAVDAIVEPTVSVVVLTYNNLDLTKSCLESLEQHSDYPRLEVIVVDNASTDGTPDFLREWASAGLHRKLILNEENQGFAAGNNQGLAAAGGDYLVLLNNDTVVTPGWVRTLLAHLRKASDVGIVGPVTNNIGNEARIETRYSGTTGMVEEAGAYTRRHPGEAFAIRTVAFFCAMLPRAVYECVGPLDEAYGTGFFEDDDYCRRIEEAGLRVLCAEDVFVHHQLSASFGKLDAEKRKALFDRNKALYETKWGAWVAHRYREKTEP